MKPTVRRLVVNWIVGAVVGTTLIGITSPLFVRTYAPLQADKIRGVWTLPEGQSYRWRREGYANSHIGPFGMPGKRSLGDRGRDIVQVALWGDSQAEGACVKDDEKIFARAEQLSAQLPNPHPRLNVYPLARSGEDGADWVTQMPAVEAEFSIDAHVMLIADLPDFAAAIDAPLPPPSKADIERANAAIAARLPAFVIQAARHLLTESDDVTPRRLRFWIGPVEEKTSSNADHTADTSDWHAAAQAIRSASTRPVIILYAPQLPKIQDGRVMVDDRAAAEFAEMKAAAEASGLIVVDAREPLLETARQGSWPHGFQNGYIGQGHLNAIGNTVVAAELVSAVRDQRRISLRESRRSLRESRRSLRERSVSIAERNTTMITAERRDFAEQNTTLRGREN